MKKIINIGGKDYTMQSSALTQFKYRDMTGRKLMQDINKIKDLREKNDDILAVLDDFLEILLMFIPFINISPSVAWYRPSNNFTSVVFPAPFSPTIDIFSPLSIVKLISLST